MVSAAELLTGVLILAAIAWAVWGWLVNIAFHLTMTMFYFTAACANPNLEKKITREWFMRLLLAKDCPESWLFMLIPHALPRYHYQWRQHIGWLFRWLRGKKHE